METTSICWLAVFVLLIVIELATMGLTTIWFAGGAVAGFIASMLGANVVIQAVVFFVVSIVLLDLHQTLCRAVYQFQQDKDKHRRPHRSGGSGAGGDQQHPGRPAVPVWKGKSGPPEVWMIP